VSEEKQEADRPVAKFKQLVTIDDSGDPGFKLDRGSSRYFVIACVIFDTTESAEAVMGAMKHVRQELGWNKKHEFKFNKLRSKDIKITLSVVADLDFRIRAVVVDKTLVQSHELRTKPSSFYNFIIKEVLSKTETLHNAKVILDGDSDKTYRKQVGAYFRKEINSPTNHKISDFSTVDSRKDILVQLADLTVGSIYRSLQTDKTDSQDYISLINKRIEDLWYFE
jgi:hypothetical protein